MAVKAIGNGPHQRDEAIRGGRATFSYVASSVLKSRRGSLHGFSDGRITSGALVTLPLRVGSRALTFTGTLDTTGQMDCWRVVWWRALEPGAAVAPRRPMPIGDCRLCGKRRPLQKRSYTYCHYRDFSRELRNDSNRYARERSPSRFGSHESGCRMRCQVPGTINLATAMRDRNRNRL
jgi:hypothetical protein